MAVVAGRVAMANPATRSMILSRVAAPQAGAVGAPTGQAGAQGLGGLTPEQTQLAFQYLSQEYGGQGAPAPQELPRQRDDDDDDDDYSRRRRGRRHKRNRRDKDDDDDDDDDDEDNKKEEEEEEKEKKKIKDEERRLAEVNKANQQLYNIDKENAIKFKKAYYESEKGDIKKYGVLIDYNGVKANVFKIKRKNNKIFSLFIMVGSKATEISRKQIMINNSPVANYSIINKIMEECFSKTE